MYLTRFAPVRNTIDATRALLRSVSPSHRHAREEIARKREAAEILMNRLADESTAKFEGLTLVDGMYDNPNYWLRYSLLRAALGLKQGGEVGLLGQFRNAECRQTFARFGIETVRKLPDLGYDEAKVRALVRDLLRQTRDAADILNWKLPDDVPGATLYDGILKRQRLSTVDIKRGDFAGLVHEAVRSIEQARTLLDGHDFRLAVLSHPYSFTWGSIAWLALRRGIDVVVPFGLFGAARMAHITKCENLIDYFDRPTGTEIDALPADQAESLRAIGAAYLTRRLGGTADDLSSIYAFKRSAESVTRANICEYFKWDPAKPIVAVYASNWYDWPHQLGMAEFRDFVDWMDATLRVAKTVPDVNWLFKPHPCEEWFGGAALERVLKPMGIGGNVGLGKMGWNNTAVMTAIDALVTYHGTAGIEFAAMGKPVLLPDRGKYHDCGFAVLARSRAEYLSLLATPWWKTLDLADVRRRAEIFSGLWFCAPQWQGGFILEDDAQQDRLFNRMPQLLNENRDAAQREVESLAGWYRSGHAYSHTYKMLRARSYQISNA